jgi:hypothetical protein
MACSICGAAHAPFGYFPPAVPTEEWRCGEHRLEGPVEREATRVAPPVRPGVCIVCDGAKVWQGAPCWCCVERLTGPRDAGYGAPKTLSGKYPDLQEWVRRYGGYWNIPWDQWDAAVADTRGPKTKAED